MTQFESQHSCYDLDGRAFRFAIAVLMPVKTLPGSIACIEDGKQLARSSGSIGANYREANDALSRKDFLMRIRLPKGGQRKRLLAAAHRRSARARSGRYREESVTSQLEFGIWNL